MATAQKTPKTSSADLRARADELQKERADLEAQVAGSEADLADSLFAGETDKASDTKAVIAAAVARIADIDHTLKGGAKALAAAEALEGEAQRKQWIAEYNAELRDGQKALDTLLAAVASLPAAGQAAIRHFATARDLYGSLFQADPAAAPVRPPAEPGRFLKDLMSNASASIYGYAGGSRAHAQGAAVRLSSLSEGCFLPDDGGQ